MHNFSFFIDIQYIEESCSKSKSLVAGSSCDEDAANNNNNSARRKRDLIPNEKKDDGYWDKRRKNNEAAKRSREKRRANDMVLEQRILGLLEENAQLRAELLAVKFRFGLVKDPSDIQQITSSAAEATAGCTEGSISGIPNSSSYLCSSETEGNAGFHAECQAEVKGTALPHKLRLKYRAMSNAPAGPQTELYPTLPQHPYLALPSNPHNGQANGDSREVDNDIDYMEEAKAEESEQAELKKEGGRKESGSERGGRNKRCD
uniref:BZIP domain-containing protein n=1 Tax=Gouania willdenowi TaxID=441366 RepID=A0A8C5DLT7_GOUWI